jgi:pyruvate kinase
VVGPISNDFSNWTLHEAVKAHFSASTASDRSSASTSSIPNNADNVASAVTESHQVLVNDGKVQLQVYGGPTSRNSASSRHGGGEEPGGQCHVSRSDVDYTLAVR